MALELVLVELVSKHLIVLIVKQINGVIIVPIVIVIHKEDHVTGDIMEQVVNVIMDLSELLVINVLLDVLELTVQLVVVILREVFVMKVRLEMVHVYVMLVILDLIVLIVQPDILVLIAVLVIVFLLEL
jgi:hypothetical protein